MDDTLCFYTPYTMLLQMIAVVLCALFLLFHVCHLYILYIIQNTQCIYSRINLGFFNQMKIFKTNFPKNYYYYILHTVPGVLQCSPKHDIIKCDNYKVST